jgi:NAD(P)-dependent dehydrogenase (short-subunit alcohol dehydrogenase family)
MLEDKRIIVTGSARGMGEATLKAYVEAGANVVGMDVSDDVGESVSNPHIFMLMFPKSLVLKSLFQKLLKFLEG